VNEKPENLNPLPDVLRPVHKRPFAVFEGGYLT